MEKGLCGTCINEKECVLPRKYPIWQCEEYSDSKPERKIAAQSKRAKRSKK